MTNLFDTTEISLPAGGKLARSWAREGEGMSSSESLIEIIGGSFMHRAETKTVLWGGRGRGEGFGTSIAVGKLISMPSSESLVETMDGSVLHCAEARTVLLEGTEKGEGPGTLAAVGTLIPGEILPTRR